MMLNKFRQSAMVSRSVMAVQASRTYLAELGLDSNTIAIRDATDKKQASLELWKA